MRPLSSQVRYAICGIFDLAYNAENKPVQLRVIGERQGIPPRYLEQIFQRLRRAGLVQGKRGPGGGYTLLLDASQISLRDVVEAVEGPIEVAGREPSHSAPDSAKRTAEGPAGGEPQPLGGESAPGFLWQVLADGLADFFAQTTIEGLCQEAARRGVRRASAEFLTYQI